MVQTQDRTPTPDEGLDRNQRLALMAILNYEMAIKPGTARNGILDTIRSRTGRVLSPADFNNFLRTASVKGCGAIFDCYRAIVSDAAYARKAPAHIRRAITEVFGSRPTASPMSASLLKVFARIAETELKANQAIARSYAGLWNIFRYSGHQGAGDERKDPYMTRAVMQVFPLESDSDGQFTPFRIHYRPHGLVKKLQLYVVEGSIIPMRQSKHMIFFGYEKQTDSPLDILTDQEIRDSGDAPIEEFRGIVKRKHEWGHFMVAKVRFTRDTKNTIDDLLPRIGMFRQSELAASLSQEYPEFDTEMLCRSVVNWIPNEGRASLRL